jgi:hypothetical protein
VIHTVPHDCLNVLNYSLLENETLGKQQWIIGEKETFFSRKSYFIYEILKSKLINIMPFIHAMP